MFVLEHHVWRTADGRLVRTGHPDAAVLAHAAGTEFTDAQAEHLGLKAMRKPADKSIAKPADKAMPAPQNKTVGDLEELRKQAEEAGVRVDNRWGPERLRQELSKAQPNSKE
jgi:hypothetical protein